MNRNFVNYLHVFQCPENVILIVCYKKFDGKYYKGITNHLVSAFPTMKSFQMTDFVSVSLIGDDNRVTAKFRSNCRDKRGFLERVKRLKSLTPGTSEWAAQKPHGTDVKDITLSDKNMIRLAESIRLRFNRIIIIGGVAEIEISLRAFYNEGILSFLWPREWFPTTNTPWDDKFRCIKENRATPFVTLAQFLVFDYTSKSHVSPASPVSPVVVENHWTTAPKATVKATAPASAPASDPAPAPASAPASDPVSIYDDMGKASILSILDNPVDSISDYDERDLTTLKTKLNYHLTAIGEDDGLSQHEFDAAMHKCDVAIEAVATKQKQLLHAAKTTEKRMATIAAMRAKLNAPPGATPAKTVKIATPVETGPADSWYSDGDD